MFWHNYFFHCAYTRYEAGLSIDEIWSFQPDSETAKIEAVEQVEQEAATEEVVVFDEAESDGALVEDSPFIPDETTGEQLTGSGAGTSLGETGAFLDSTETTPPGSATSDFEMLDDGEENGGTGDPELDELEAEIARELED